MDLDKLSQDIKASFAFTANLKQEKEELQNTVNALKDHVAFLEGLINGRLKDMQEGSDRNNEKEDVILDKIIALQTDEKLKQDFKDLSKQHRALRHQMDEEQAQHSAQIKDIEATNQQMLQNIREKHSFELDAVQACLRVEIDGIREKLEQTEKQKNDELLQAKRSYEEKLEILKRSASNTLNVDIYKRKLAAQRAEFMRENDALRQQLAQMQRRGR